MTGRGWALAGFWVLCACALGVAAAPASAVSRQTYSVPVTQPDEAGLAVALDVDVYLPDGSPPASGWPLVEIFHGGGSEKSNGYDAGHARFFAERGYASLIYSARGHGDSGGQTSVAGPKEMRDLFDVSAWAFGVGGRSAPPHPDFRLDRERIALAGYSQGGLHTNLGQVYARDPAINPYGLRFRALLPGNTPDVVFNALVDNQVVKQSIGVALLGTYTAAGSTRARIAPAVLRWLATAGADRPELYGGAVCDATGHDTPSSTIRQDLAARSVGCFADQMTPPVLWAQALDDTLFPPDMAISMWRRMPSPSKRLYLDMAGHGAPAEDPAQQKDELTVQLAFLESVIRGAKLALPPVIYWTRDPGIRVPAGTYRYPAGAWYRQTAGGWPPAGVREVGFTLGADGRAVRGTGALAGSQPLGPPQPDQGNDPIVLTVLGATPLGTTPASAAPQSTSAPGVVAGFLTDAYAAPTELSGRAVARVPWNPSGPDSQLVIKVFDRAPDGVLTLLARGVQGLRGAEVARRTVVTLATDTFSTLVRPGHRMLATIAAGDASFYKAYPGQAGGELTLGAQATLTLPERSGVTVPGQRPACRDRVAPRSTIDVRSFRMSRGRITLAGRSSDRGCGRRGIGRVSRVFLAVYRPERGGCRMLTVRGRLSARRACRRPILLRAAGTARWHFTRRTALPGGLYQVWVLAVDAVGNRERGRRLARARYYRLR